MPKGSLSKFKRRFIIIDLFNEELFDMKNFIFVFLVFSLHILPIYTLNNPSSHISKTSEYYELNGQLNHVEGMYSIPAKDLNGRIHSYVRCIDTRCLEVIKLGTIVDKFCPLCEKKLIDKKYRSEKFLKCKKCRDQIIQAKGGIIKCSLREIETKGINEYVLSQLMQSMGILFYLGTVYSPLIILVVNIRSILEDKLKRDGMIKYLLVCYSRKEIETILELYGGIYMVLIPLIYLGLAKSVYRTFILKNIKNILGSNIYSTAIASNPAVIQLAGSNNVSVLYAISQILTIVYFENTLCRLSQLQYVSLIKKIGYCILGIIFYVGYKNNVEIISVYSYSNFERYCNNIPYGQFEYIQSYSKIQKQLIHRKSVLYILNYKYKQNYLLFYILFMTILYILGKNAPLFEKYR
jgi:hypothetical protein